MADAATSRIPRETLVGLLASTSSEGEKRITAPIPVPELDELLTRERVDAVRVEVPSPSFVQMPVPASVPLPGIELATGSNPEVVVRFTPTPSRPIVVDGEDAASPLVDLGAAPAPLATPVPASHSWMIGATVLGDRSHHVIAISCIATLMFGVLLILFLV